MRNDLIQSATPEEAELAVKKAELERLSQVLSEKQLDLEELKLAVGRFQHRYFREIGRKYVELDELRAIIAELKMRKHPSDQALHHAAEMAHKQARQTAEEYQGMGNEPEPAPQEFGESEEVKKLYRRIASIIHPDRVMDDRSRELRTRLMAELNDAYSRRDVARMQAILSQWEGSPEAVSGEGTGVDLVRIIRAIAQMKRRISDIEQEISKIMSSDVHMLMVRVHETDLTGRNILAEMSEAIDLEIQEAKQQLAELRR